ncbi:LysR family transcriptional regulator [Roseovarius spongiae]|uniref:LysR family transcriptional regulator n=1 Tax=Roseovarius spongiae TaxID=2320272 RepID=A0A3A8AXB4_9RHOB|nr:LysR family transcriptional regulator [Roseovarius spongiae]RKF17088.1 LysR family transcriptional regulator [Roseovarius spongiae]
MKLTGSDIHMLSVFASVVRNAGFSAAQVELGLSQPTISNHITALEERLGVKLCQRGRRGFLLTEKGRMVHEIAEALLGTLDTHSVHLAELRGNLVGRLRIAVVDALNTDPRFRLPAAIRAFSEAAPAVRIELEVARPQDILNGILDGSYHVGVGSFDNIINGLKVDNLYSERHALYCAPEHPCFADGGAGLGEAQLRRMPWVHRGYWSQQRQKSFGPSDADRFVNQIDAQLTMVLSGRYLGLLPEHMAAEFVARGRLRRMAWTGADFSCVIQCVRRAGPPPKVIDRFTEILCAQYTGE